MVSNTTAEDFFLELRVKISTEFEYLCLQYWLKQYNKNVKHPIKSRIVLSALFLEYLPIPYLIAIFNKQITDD